MLYGYFLHWEKTLFPHVKNCHLLHLMPWMIGNVNKVDVFFLVGSLCNNQYNTWLLGDIESLFVCTTPCLACETLSSFLPTPMCHSPLIFPWARLCTINQSYLYLSALGSSWQSFYSVVQHKVVILAAEHLKKKKTIISLLNFLLLLFASKE